MSFYPDEGDGDDLEIENKYSLEDFDIKKETDDQSDNFKDSKIKKSNPTSGINHEELRKRIESFNLSDDYEDEANEDDLAEDDLIFEDEEGVPSIKEENLSRVKANQEVDNLEERGVFLKEDPSKLIDNISENKKEKLGGSLSWYIKISRLPIFLITLYSILILFRGYLITIFSNLTDFANNIYWLDTMKWPFEILVFLVTTYVIIKKKKQLPRIAGIAGVMIGFSAGVIIAVIKLFWYREMWNIFYLSAESIFLALTGFVVALLSSALFYEEHK